MNVCRYIKHPVNSEIGSDADAVIPFVDAIALAECGVIFFNLLSFSPSQAA